MLKARYQVLLRAKGKSSKKKFPLVNKSTKPSTSEIMVPTSAYELSISLDSTFVSSTLISPICQPLIQSTYLAPPTTQASIQPTSSIYPLPDTTSTYPTSLIYHTSTTSILTSSLCITSSSFVSAIYPMCNVISTISTFPTPNTTSTLSVFPSSLQNSYTSSNQISTFLFNENNTLEEKNDAKQLKLITDEVYDSKQYPDFFPNEFDQPCRELNGNIKNIQLDDAISEISTPKFIDSFENSNLHWNFPEQNDNKVNDDDNELQSLFDNLEKIEDIDLEEQEKNDNDHF
jgi:hypothetical protein